MATARMTMIGLFNNFPDSFTDISFPEGIDRTMAINSIVLRCGEAPLLYPNPDMMKSVLTLTASKWYSNIERMLLAIDSEYNPIHNYDRHEEWHEDDDKDETHTNTKNLKTTNETESNETNNIESDRTSTQADTLSKTVQNDVSAFNDSNYQPSDKSTESGANSTDFDDNTTTESSNHQSGTGEINQTGSETNAILSNNDLDHNGHLYGNIGVTTTQSMITDEVEMRKKINIYEVISEIFYKECCIYVY